MPLGMVPQGFGPRRRLHHVGPTPGKRRGDDLELSPSPSGGCGGVDPDRHRPVAASLSHAGGGPGGGLASLGGVSGVGFGESFGGIFAPGLTGCSVRRGGALLLRRRRPHRPSGSGLGDPPARTVRPCVMGCSSSRWRCSRLGQVGAFGAARPGRAGWDAHGDGPADGPDASASILSVMGDELRGVRCGHGWGVNLFVVVALAAIGGAFLSARPRIALVAVVAPVVLCWPIGC